MCSRLYICLVTIMITVNVSRGEFRTCNNLCKYHFYICVCACMHLQQSNSNLNIIRFNKCFCFNFLTDHSTAYGVQTCSCPISIVCKYCDALCLREYQTKLLDTSCTGEASCTCKFQC